MTRFRRLGDTEVHRGHVWNVVVADFESHAGEPFRRDIVRSPGSVAVVPLLHEPDGRESVVLVDQYRPAYERHLIELPAGMRDVPGESVEATGHRELAEEVGLAAAELVHLIDLLPSPGMTDAVCSIFLATGCTPVAHDRQGPEEEDMEVLRVPLAEALAMIDRGEIGDAKTVVGLLLTDRRLQARRTGAHREDRPDG